MTDVAVEAPVDADDIAIPAILPVLPLKETVVFPQSMTPLAIGQERSIRLVDDVVAGDRMLILLTAKTEAEEPGWKDLYDVGTAGIVHRLIRIPDGTLRVLVGGLRRVKLDRTVQDDPYLIGEFSSCRTCSPSPRRRRRSRATCRTSSCASSSSSPYLPEELQIAAANIDDPGVLTYLVASTLRLKAEEKQHLLETVDVEARLRETAVILNRELEVLELGTKIQSQVQSEMEKTQREYFLRQQLKAIQDELGEGDEEQAELRELRERIEAANLPEEALKAGEPRALTAREAAVGRGGVRRHPHVPRAGSSPCRGTQTTKDNLDLDQAREVLDDDHYDLEQREGAHPRVPRGRKLKGDVSGQILCFVGPPGVGKTSLGQSIAAALGRKFVRISVGGVRDEAEIRGHRRTYIGAHARDDHPALRDAETRNPVFMIDEIDKMGADWRGDPASAMLEVLDPEQNAAFRDHYLDLPFDLSKVLFICTANQLGADPRAVARPHGDHRASGYTEDEKVEIARRYLVPRAARRHGLKPRRVEFTDEAIRLIAASYTREAGVRGLERENRRHLPQDRVPRSRRARSPRTGSTRERARVARPAPLRRRGPRAHLRSRRSHRARRHGGRRRRPLRRGDRLPGQGRAHGHRPARRGDAGVGPGGAVLGAEPRRAARASTPRGSRSTTSTSTFPRARYRRTGRRRGSRSRQPSSRSPAGGRFRATSR